MKIVRVAGSFVGMWSVLSDMKVVRGSMIAIPVRLLFYIRVSRSDLIGMVGEDEGFRVLLKIVHFYQRLMPKGTRSLSKGVTKCRSGKLW